MYSITASAVAQRFSSSINCSEVPERRRETSIHPLDPRPPPTGPPFRPLEHCDRRMVPFHRHNRDLRQCGPNRQPGTGVPVCLIPFAPCFFPTERRFYVFAHNALNSCAPPFFLKFFLTRTYFLLLRASLLCLLLPLRSSPRSRRLCLPPDRTPRRSRSCGAYGR